MGSPPMTQRSLLPLLTPNRHGGRSAMTCLYRCGNACDHPEPNPTDHPRFRDVVEASLVRRSVLRSGAVAAGLAVVGRGVPATAAKRAPEQMADISGLRFDPVAPNVRDDVTVPLGFGHHVVIA